jgi:hypothetical protein
MHPTYDAALHVLRTSFALLAESFDGLPDAALDWTPVSGTNSLTVLCMHGLTSTQFWVAAAAGLKPDRANFVEHVRGDAFRARGATVANLRAEIARTEQELAEALAHGDDDALRAEVGWEDFGRQRTGAEALIISTAHLREHVGQAQLMRDLWLAASREGR